MTKIDTQRLRELMDFATKDVTVSPTGVVSYPAHNCHPSVAFLAKHGPALLARIAELEAEREWRPIESAPKDGTRIMLGRPDHDGDGGISVCGYWLEELDDGIDYMGSDGGFTDVDYQVFSPGRSFGAEAYRYAGSQPTHWKPLPDPPSLVPVAEVG